MAYEKIILKKENSDDKLYPRTLASELINDDESAFAPQAKLSSGTGIKIDSNNTISSILYINNTAPTAVTVEETILGYNWNLDTTNRTIDDTPTLGNTDHLVSSDGIYKFGLQRITTVTNKTYSTVKTYGSDVANDIKTAYATFRSNLPSKSLDSVSGININLLSPIRIYVFFTVIDLQKVTYKPIEVTISNPTLVNGDMVVTSPGMTVRYVSSSAIIEDTVANFFQNAGVSNSAIRSGFKNLKIVVCCDGFKV